MSMREYPSSGYIIPLEDGGCLGTIQAYLLKTLPSVFPPFYVYQPSDTDTVDESMDQEQYYLVFDEEELFIKLPRNSLKILRNMNLEPNFANWSVWC